MYADQLQSRGRRTHAPWRIRYELSRPRPCAGLGRKRHSVLPNASAVVCSSSQNSDLFWGLRGAGSNFGVVSSFQFRTYAAPSAATTFLISLDWPTKSQRVKGIDALRYFVEKDMPPELNLRLQIGAFGSRATPILQGTYYGSASTLNATLAPLLSSIKGQFSSQVSGGWLDSLKYFADGVPLDQGNHYTGVCEHRSHSADFYPDTNKQPHLSMTASTLRV